MKFLSFLLLGSIALSAPFAFAVDREVANYPGCNQTFTKDTYLYPGKKNIPYIADRIDNSSSNAPAIFLEREIKNPELEFPVAGIISATLPSFKFSNEFLCGGTGFCPADQYIGESYAMVKPDSNVRWIESTSDLIVNSVSSSVSPADFSRIREEGLIVKYFVKGRFYRNGSLDMSSKSYHVECQKFGVHWCGDGVVDSAEGETCDDGSENGQPGKCSTTCDSTVPQDPVCGNGVIETGETCDDGNTNNDDSCNNQCEPNTTQNNKCDTLTVSDTSISVGDTINASCTTTPVGQATNISCGGGTGGGTGPTTCTYNAAGTYTVSCTLQEDFSPSIPCNTTVTVTEAPTEEYIDLSIKKYIESNDAQTASAGVTQNTDDTFNYVIRVQNKGTKMVTSETTVQDTLPSGVELNGTPSGSNWTCTTSGQSITCVTGQDVAAGAYFTDITVPVKVTATSGTVTNHATVYNPDEDSDRSCLPNNQKPAVTATNCTQDGDNEDPAVFVVNEPDTEISIKKYAENLEGTQEADGQNGNNALGVAPGDEYYYKYVVTVTGEHENATVTDTFPHQVEFVEFESNSGWNCTTGSITENGNTLDTFICTKDTIEAGTYTIKAKVKLKADLDSDEGQFRNIAYVCSDETGTVNNQNGNTVACNPECTDPNNSACVPEEPPEDCSSIPTDANYDPACVEVERKGINLKIKKYIESNDAQTASQGPKKAIGDTFDYVIKVENIGSETATGETVVHDILPEGVELDADEDDIQASGWDCDEDDGEITCKTTEEVAPDNFFKEIRIPVKVNKDANSTVRNYTTVYNPNETENGCYDDNEEPTGNVKDCENDDNNVDVAVFTLSGDDIDLEIKKYINSKDANTKSDAVEMEAGEEFEYRLKVRNIGTKTVTGDTIVHDVLPDEITITDEDDIEADGWDCDVDGQEVTCTTDEEVDPDDYFETITLPVELDDDADGTIKNYATVYNENETENGCYDDNEKPTGNVKDCENDDSNVDPAVLTIDGGDEIDLKIKKYIDSKDANSAIEKEDEDEFDYVLKVKNIGDKTVEGKTTVRDYLPKYVELDGNPKGDDWDCDVSSDDREIICTTTEELDPGDYFPDIEIPVKVDTSQERTVKNYATVYNPNEDDNGCYDDNDEITDDDIDDCENDDNNIDVAIFETEDDDDDDDKRYIGLDCFDTEQLTCRSYTSKSACKSATGDSDLCWVRDDEGYDECNDERDDYTEDDIKVLCGKVELPTPTCGNGILDAGEECDPGSTTSWCDASCKVVDTNTNPGQNAYQFYINIPGLANLGYNGGKTLPFTEHGIVAGRGTNIFTVADKINLKLNTELNAPIKIPTNKNFCLQEVDGGTKILENTAMSCTNLASIAGLSDIFTTSVGTSSETEWVVLGRGDYLVPANNASGYEVKIANGTDEVELFKGSATYADKNGNQKTPRDAFRIKDSATPGSESAVALAAQSANNPNVYLPLTQFTVQVSNSLLGTTSTPVNQVIEGVLKFSAIDITNKHLKQLAGKTSVSGTTSASQSATPASATSLESLVNTLLSENNTTASTVSSGGDSLESLVGSLLSSSTTLVNDAIDITIPSENKKSSLTVDELSDLKDYKLNGNSDIYAIEGKVTVECESGEDEFEMSGVKTVLVQGDIIIKCDTKYKSSSSSHSWAWIAQGGNISVHPDVEALEGVYVAIKEGNTDGDINSIGGEISRKILEISGTLYGDAQPLFNSRTYARGSGVYNSLTTGVILTYSNKALVSTPPLLTRYLDHYKLSRVTQ